MQKTTVTIEQVREMGRKDAQAQVSESGDNTTPDGGWDSWLINGIGIDKTCELFGEPIDDRDGWSPAMAEKLKAYHEAACDAVES